MLIAGEFGLISKGTCNYDPLLGVLNFKVLTSYSNTFIVKASSNSLINPFTGQYALYHSCDLFYNQEIIIKISDFIKDYPKRVFCEGVRIENKVFDQKISLSLNYKGMQLSLKQDV